MTRSTKWADMNALDKRLLLTFLEQGVAEADTEDYSDKRNAAGKMMTAMFAWLAKNQISAELSTTICAEWAELQMLRLKQERNMREAA